MTLLAKRSRPTNILRTLRDAKGWSVREAAARTTCSSATISRVERTGVIEIHHFVSLIRAYGFDVLAETIERMLEVPP